MHFFGSMLRALSHESILENRTSLTEYVLFTMYMTIVFHVYFGGIHQYIQINLLILYISFSFQTLNICQERNLLNLFCLSHSCKCLLCKTWSVILCGGFPENRLKGLVMFPFNDRVRQPRTFFTGWLTAGLVITALNLEGILSFHTMID